ncbi:hypothetical protein [Shewanella baltica]|uniref:hypothetical protein n=1 Tax=Shewanella baltica TaxID=62322 RepID=UPI00217E136A|nr:hypothetical protein [Shewanella baltica]MCS6179236.1 hypothetical protein [Shewanella baltica]MCS6255320.1 hypothetical protein [Shewanella baltica]
MKKVILPSLAIFSIFFNISPSSDSSNQIQFNLISSANAIERIETVGKRPPQQLEFGNLLNGGGGWGGSNSGSGMFGGNSSGSSSKKKQCLTQAEDLRSECISLYGGSGVVLATMCKWFEKRTGAVFGTACSGTVALSTVQAYRWCNTQSDKQVEKCD